MKTKAELEKEIELLKQVIEKQKREAALLESRYVCVRIPNPNSIRFSHAPYVGTMKEDSWREKVAPVIFTMLRAHGEVRDFESPWPKKTLDFADAGRCHGDWVNVPVGVAELVMDLVNAAGDFGADCFRKGFETATGMLRQLAAGEVSAEEFEDRAVRERIRDTQSNRFRIKDSH